MLTITEATKKWRVAHTDKFGNPYVDKKGQPKPRFFPIGYKIELHNGMTLSVNDTAHGRSFTLRDSARQAELDFFGRPSRFVTLSWAERKVLFNGSLNALKVAYNHCSMAELAEQGILMAEEDAIAKRAA